MLKRTETILKKTTHSTLDGSFSHVTTSCGISDDLTYGPRPPLVYTFCRERTVTRGKIMNHVEQEVEVKQ
jgi:hypothetical protein